MSSDSRFLKLTKQAIADLEEIYSYWNERNRSLLYSEKLNSEFITLFSLILKMPAIGKLVNRKSETRAKLHRDYWIVYSVNSEYIQIIRVWEIRQNPEKLKKYFK